jgi:predicted DNA-binding transcriptional regulator YafY
MSRARRLLQLVQLLRRHRRPVTAETLAEGLEISVRSLYRDIATLRAQGAPIEGEAGVGYVLRPGFLLPPLMFGETELEALVLGLRLAEAHGDALLGAAAVDALAKLRAVLPDDARDLVDGTGLLAGPSQERPVEQIDLGEVRRAIRAQEKVRIVYADASGRGTERTIWPLALAFFARVRLVVGYCESREDFRNFRTDRIARWTPTGAPMPRPRAALLREWQARESIPEPLAATRTVARKGPERS